jgi:glutamate--cysteine ligase
MQSPLIHDPEQLTGLFRRAEKPRQLWRVGMEAEKFAFADEEHRPAQYDGPGGVRAILEWMSSEWGWVPVRETEAGPIVALTRDQASITLEPGAQFELSGAPAASLHAVAREYRAHLADLSVIHRVFGVWFAHLGFHPFATHQELPWVPKRRYPIMREYLPTKGSRALDMMLRTATVQVNLDYESERNAMDTLIVLLRLTPLLQAMTLNSPFIEGRTSSLKSERLDVWMNMDPNRSGLLQRLWDKPAPTYMDYVEWSLDAGMFLVLRDGKLVQNTGQTFRDYLANGFGDARATEADWQLHLGTLFPEVRLKNTIEVRCCDALPPELALAVPALLVGLTHDPESLDRAREVAERIPTARALDLQREVGRRGLDAALDATNNESVQGACMKLLEIATAGLDRRATIDDGESAATMLEPLRELTERGQTPADVLLERLEQTGSIGAALEASQGWTV